LWTTQRSYAITIAQAKSLPSGTAATIDNVVITNTVDLVNSATVKNFHVQDATDGITVFGGNGEIDGILTALAPGGLIDLSGSLAACTVLFELESNITTALSSTVVTPGVGVPAPEPTTTADYQDFSATAERLESRFVSLKNVHFTGVLPGQTFAGLTK